MYKFTVASAHSKFLVMFLSSCVKLKTTGSDSVLEYPLSEEPKNQATISSNLFLCWFAKVYCVSYYGGLDAPAALWTNQMGYIIH